MLKRQNAPSAPTAWYGVPPRLRRIPCLPLTSTPNNVVQTALLRAHSQTGGYVALKRNSP
jgi:hypothetical protein